MPNKYIGKKFKRNEDPRLLTGNAVFVDDVHLPDMAHAVFMRSPYAHARIRSIDVEQARQVEGVIAVFTAADLGAYWKPAPLLVPPPPIEGIIFNERTQPPLAKDKVRFAGEPVAVVVAKDRYLAEDALNLIRVDYEYLPPVADLEKALNPDVSLIHEDLNNNLAAHVIQKKGNYKAIRASAHKIVKRKYYYDRGTAAAMENRGVLAHWDKASAKLSIWDTTQAPIPIRNGLAKMLGLSENQVRVVAPFIGGGFGPKIMMFYQEEVIIPWVSMQLNLPIKWIEDREENFTATTHERAQIHEAEMAIDEQGHILGIHDVFLHDSGAYDPYGLTVPINSQCTLLGVYDVPNYYSEFKAVFTNKTIVTPYRGAGRQHGVFVMERLLDLAAREVGIDPVEIRRRNLIPPEAFPYNNEIIYQDFTKLTYDSGNYKPLIDKAVEMIGYDNFVQNVQPKLKAQGKMVGIGLVSYVEGTGIGPYEGARVQILSSGKVSVVTGIGTQGQGHFTSFAQIAAEQFDVPVEDVEVVTGDTDQFHWGTGTFASRGAVVAGNAVHAAAMEVRKKTMALASSLFNVPESDLDLAGGRVFLRNDPNKALSLGELAEKANPLRGAVKPGTDPGLESTQYFGPESGVTSAGVHAMILEVNPKTMEINISKYVVVHDCGVVINPLIVEGQIQGGVAQGLGNAFYEELVYHPQHCTLENASLRDFYLPTALEVPKVEMAHFETPSPFNPMGVKGTGEAGAIPVAPLFAQAVENAFSDLNLEILHIPLTPSRLWQFLQKD